LIWNDLHVAILRWYRESGRDLPWRATRDPYAVLVSEIMLQQTQVDRVLPKYQAFLARFPDFASLAAAPAAEVIRAWQGLGYNRRAVRLQRIAQEVVERYGGTLPDTVSGLLELDGIGRYTAAAVACFAFGKPEPVLDTNVRRVLGRIALGPDGPLSATPATLWKLAEEALPEPDAYDWNQALMDLGARVCLERNPTCLLCPARQWCASAGRIGSSVRERSAVYTAKPAPSFTGSSRYYRGRIVERLRALASGETITLSALGPSVRPGYGADDEEWLGGLVDGLARDGLLERRADGAISLP
jgi:A/G-specific adenine glycosylase